MRRQLNSAGLKADVAVKKLLLRKGTREKGGKSNDEPDVVHRTMERTPHSLYSRLLGLGQAGNSTNF